MGDILRVEEDDSFPCDLVLLSAANDEGKCFITTANLDGETNLKVRSFVLAPPPPPQKNYWHSIVPLSVPRPRSVPERRAGAAASSS